MSKKTALYRVLFWVSTALLFNAGVWYFKGADTALDFFTGYVIEYSLSVDNLFVFIMIFTYFSVDGVQQQRALNWGIMGAIIFRIVFVLFGVTLIHHFHSVIYIFGALLLWSAYKMAFIKEKGIEPEKIALVRWFKKLMPVTNEYVEAKFFVRIDGKLAATPLLIVVLVVESSDIMFAIDSIPAILAITQDPFIVISSNIFAILGLRSLYFLLAGIMGIFRFLKQGVAVILGFVGIKMLLMDHFKIPTMASLLVIVSILTLSILLSKLIPEKKIN